MQCGKMSIGRTVARSSHKSSFSNFTETHSVALVHQSVLQFEIK